MKKNKNLLLNIGLLILVLIICFVVLEIATRIIWDDNLTDYPPDIYQSDENLGYKYTHNFQGSFISQDGKELSFSTNSKGLRDEEHSYEKEDDIIRILTLGDSVTFGAGVSLNESYTKILEKDLKDSGRNVEIINTGVGGYELDQEYIYYVSEGYKYNASIVLYGIVLNDIQQVNISKVMQEKQNINQKSGFRIFIRDHCKSCKFIYSVIKNSQENRDEYNQLYFESIYSYWENESLYGRYEKELFSLKEEVEKNGGKLVLVVFPYTEQFVNSQDFGNLPQEKLKEFANQNNLVLVDLKDDLDSSEYLSHYLVKDDVHPNSEGHKISAEKIYKELLANEIIK
jgi:hypothetical protein